MISENNYKLHSTFLRDKDYSKYFKVYSHMCFLMRADHALVRIRDLLKERLLAVIEKIWGVY